MVGLKRTRQLTYKHLHKECKAIKYHEPNTCYKPNIDITTMLMFKQQETKQGTYTNNVAKEHNIN